MYESLIAGIGGAIVLIIGAVVAGVLKLRTWNSQQEKTTIGYLQGIIDNHARRMEVAEKQLQDYAARLEALAQRCADCHAENEMLWAMATQRHDEAQTYYDFAISLIEERVKEGRGVPLRPRPPQPMPERHSHFGARSAQDLARRNAEQSAVTSQDMQSGGS